MYFHCPLKLPYLNWIIKCIFIKLAHRLVSFAFNALMKSVKPSPVISGFGMYLFEWRYDFKFWCWERSEDGWALHSSGRHGMVLGFLCSRAAAGPRGGGSEPAPHPYVWRGCTRDWHIQKSRCRPLRHVLTNSAGQRCAYRAGPRGRLCALGLKIIERDELIIIYTSAILKDGFTL